MARKHAQKKTRRSSEKDERALMRKIREAFHENIDWHEFENLIFGLASAFFKNSDSYRSLSRNSLFLEARQMWHDLGVAQGHIPERFS